MPIPNAWLQKGKWLIKCQTGLGLAEVLVSIAIMSSALVALISSMTTGAKAVDLADRRVTAHHLAEAQMEYIQSYPYDLDANYPRVGTPTRHGFTWTINVATPPATILPDGDTEFLGASLPDSETSIQYVTVTVSNNSGTVTSISTFKGKR
ncbi:MAG: hypothetical protein HQ553_07810 [Chloroflexi bacterium]|nr:hypothetical protein [Chloroflexota bacterium]